MCIIIIISCYAHTITYVYVHLYVCTTANEINFEVVLLAFTVLCLLFITSFFYNSIRFDSILFYSIHF